MALGLIRDNWGNPGYSASYAYLQAVARHARAARVGVLETGSGATSLVVASVKRSSVYFAALEHLGPWVEKVNSILPRDYVLWARLAPRGTYEWYDLPDSSRQRDFDLLICDGPPGSTPGGRFGAVPELGPHLINGAIILLDDTHREGERSLIDSWNALRHLEVLESVTDEAGRAYSVLRVGASRGNT